MLGFPPRGGADAMAHLIAIKLEKELGQPMVVENKSGATGTICSAFVAQAAPDGYTVQLAHVRTNAIGPLQLARGKFEPIKAFTPIGLVGITPHLLAVNHKQGFASVADLIATAKAAPVKLTFMSAVLGSAPHMAGDVDMTFSSTGAVQPRTKSGKLKILGICSLKRQARRPDVPAISKTCRAIKPSLGIASLGLSSYRQRSLRGTSQRLKQFCLKLM
jgi:tripartite-type tricarboxylate transporter receptor subunit TctC